MNILNICIIGDIHGRNYWKTIDFNLYDIVVFIGDYVDSFDIPINNQVLNLEDLVRLKQSNPSKFIFIIANHDASYLHDFMICSGYQPKMKYQFRDLLLELDLQVAYKYRDYLFTHAGVSKTWYNTYKDLVSNIEGIDNKLNTLYKHRPKAFCFNGRNPYGDNITQSPIWIRPKSLSGDSIGYIQVVGHTQVEKPIINGNIILIDSPDYYCELINDKFSYKKYGR